MAISALSNSRRRFFQQQHTSTIVTITKAPSSSRADVTSEQSSGVALLVRAVSPDRCCGDAQGRLLILSAQLSIGAYSPQVFSRNPEY